MTRQPYQLIRVVHTPAYGMHRATVRTPEGREVSALGTTPQRAELTARAKAQRGDD